MYVPMKNGEPVEDSGPTIGKGIDIGQMNEGDLQKLVEHYGLSQELANKLKPYLGLKKQAAVEKVRKSPLRMSEAEVEMLSAAKYSQIFTALERLYNEDSKVKFKDLPANAQTVIASVALQHGEGLRTETPKFWSYVIAQDWAKAKAELEDFGDGFATRRRKEAVLLKDFATKN